MGMSNKELLNSLQQMIDAALKRMAEMCGMQLYQKREGFTQEDIYTLCGIGGIAFEHRCQPE